MGNVALLGTLPIWWQVSGYWCLETPVGVRRSSVVVPQRTRLRSGVESPARSVGQVAPVLPGRPIGILVDPPSKQLAPYAPKSSLILPVIYQD